MWCEWKVVMFCFSILLLVATVDCGKFGHEYTISEMNQLYNPHFYLSHMTKWDGTQLTGCMCDYGYTGERCQYSKRSIPYFCMCHIC